MKTKKCPTCGYPKSDIQYCSPKCKSDAEKRKKQLGADYQFRRV